jgi:hypothetical protein
MASTAFLLVAVMVAVTPISAAGVSAQIFPSMRKHQKQFMAMNQNSDAPAGPAQAPAAVFVVAPGTATAAKKTEVEVPAAVDVGADGFPQLPEVSTILSEASGTLKSVNSQASSLQAKVVQVQMQSESRMAKQKAAFEEKLKQQEQGNQMVITANANISSEIKNLKKRNADLRKHAKQLQESNRVMRTELHSLEGRLLAAKEFTTASLKSTDDSKNSLLQVLKTNGNGNRHHHNTLVETSSSSKRDADDDDDEEDSDDTDSDDDDSDDAADSFLSVSMETHRSSADGASSFMAAISELESAVPAVGAQPVEVNSEADPSDLLTVLAKDVSRLAEQEKKSEKELKARFIKDFRAGAKRHQALMSQQKGLIATRGSLLALQAQLKDAEAHLEATKKALQSRLHAIGQFMQKLAHFAMAPEHEVPHLMEVLPKDVPFPAKTEKKHF